MSVLKALTDALRGSSVEVIDLTAPLTAKQAPIAGLGVETVGTGAGAAHSFDPPRR